MRKLSSSQSVSQSTHGFSQNCYFGRGVARAVYLLVSQSVITPPFCSSISYLIKDDFRFRDASVRLRWRFPASRSIHFGGLRALKPLLLAARRVADFVQLFFFVPAPGPGHVSAALPARQPL